MENCVLVNISFSFASYAYSYCSEDLRNELEWAYGIFREWIAFPKSALYVLWELWVKNTFKILEREKKSVLHGVLIIVIEKLICDFNGCVKIVRWRDLVREDH